MKSRLKAMGLAALAVAALVAISYGSSPKNGRRGSNRPDGKSRARFCAYEPLWPDRAVVRFQGQGGSAGFLGDLVRSVPNRNPRIRPDPKTVRRERIYNAGNRVG